MKSDVFFGIVDCDTICAGNPGLRIAHTRCQLSLLPTKRLSYAIVFGGIQGVASGMDARNVRSCLLRLSGSPGAQQQSAPVRSTLSGSAPV